MNNNYKIIRTIFENVFQRVLECKDNDTGDIFYSNIITSQKVINLINLEELKMISSNILECYNTEDRIYIYTKPLKEGYKGLRESLTNNLTLKKQFNLSGNIITLAQNIFNMTDVVQQKILDLDKIYIDSNNKVIVDCNLIFEQEFDIADNETYKRLGNIIHFIFSGSEIIDYNISDSIPPDILKIIVRCLTKEYIFPEDVLTELRNSPIYAMIFGIEDFKEDKITEDDFYYENVIKEQQEIESDIYDGVADDNYSENATSILDIYLKDNNVNEPIKNKKSSFNKKDITRAVISILIVVVVLVIGNKLIKDFSGSEVSNTDNIQDKIENQSPSEVPSHTETPSEENKETVQSEISDSTELYFNEQLLNNLGYTGNKAEIDNNIYVEGKNSLVIANEGEGKVKSLFAVVDFNNEKFNYMLKKQIGIAAKMKSENDVTAQVVLEAYKDGILASNFHTSTDIFNDMWGQFNVHINVTDADSLYVYIEQEGKNKVWVDSIYIDVIK